MKGSEAIELPEDDPYIFDTYLGCLYKGNIDLACIYKDKIDIGDLTQADTKEQSEIEAVYHHLLQPHVLADKLLDVITANLIMDAMIYLGHSARVIPLPALVKLALDVLPKKSPVSRHLLDTFIHEASVEDIETLRW
jgi:hypothetical protein